MSDHELPIRYRDFYDIPRAFVVEREERLYLFDCLFNHEIGDYEDFYSVYLVPDGLRREIDRMSWVDLGNRSEWIGRVKTVEVQFDETRRIAIGSRTFAHIRSAVS